VKGCIASVVFVCSALLRARAQSSSLTEMPQMHATWNIKVCFAIMWTCALCLKIMWATYTGRLRGLCMCIVLTLSASCPCYCVRTQGEYVAIACASY